MASEAGNWLKNIVGLLAKLGTTTQERRRNWKFDSNHFVITDNPGQDYLEFALAGAGVVPTAGAANTVLQSNGSAAVWNAALTLGDAAAASGSVRGTSPFTLYVRRYEGPSGEDVHALVVTTGDEVVLGANSSHNKDTRVEAPTGQAVRIKVAGDDVLAISGALIAASQDVRMNSAKSVDCHTNGGYLKPRRVRQADQPTPAANEALIWSDSDDDSVHLLYNDDDAGVVELGSSP